MGGRPDTDSGTQIYVVRVAHAGRTVKTTPDQQPAPLKKKYKRHILSFITKLGFLAARLNPSNELKEQALTLTLSFSSTGSPSSLSLCLFHRSRSLADGAFRSFPLL